MITGNLPPFQFNKINFKQKLYMETKHGFIPSKEIVLSSIPLKPESAPLGIRKISALNKHFICSSDSETTFEIQKRKTSLPRKLSPQLAYFIGYFLGDLKFRLAKNMLN